MHISAHMYCAQYVMLALIEQAVTTLRACQACGEVHCDDKPYMYHM